MKSYLMRKGADDGGHEGRATNMAPLATQVKGAAQAGTALAFAGPGP
jgi:hypothetical protein